MTSGFESDILRSIEVKVGYNPKSNFTEYRVLGNSERQVFHTYSEEEVITTVRDYLKRWRIRKRDIKITDLTDKGYKKLTQKQKDQLKASFFVRDDLHCEA